MKSEMFGRSQYARLARRCVLSVHSTPTNQSAVIHWLKGFCAANAEKQAALKLRIKEICETRVRFGCRSIHVLLRREGWNINVKRVRRLYTEQGLQLRNKTPKR